MSLEHTLLNRLEARSMQLAQMKKEIHGLKQLVDEKMTINEQLSEQITSARLEREQMQHQIAELKTERDRILEISKNLVPKSALKQAVMEAAGLSSEVAKLRAEIPLESTREALKNAVAKLQEVTTDRDRLQNELAAIYAEANKSGYCNGDPVAQIKKGQQDHDAAESMERQLEAYSSVSNARAHEIARLNAKLGPLEKLYEVVKKHVDNGAIIDNRADIYDAVAETAKALSSLQRKLIRWTRKTTAV